MYQSADQFTKIPKSGKSVLVVEDNSGLRFVLTEWLRSLNYTVMEAASADEAVIALNTSDVFHCVVTDVQMPGSMDGFGLMSHIQNTFPDLDVIVVSSDDSHEQLKKETVLFFKKPYNLDDMALSIAGLITLSEAKSLIIH